MGDRNPQLLLLPRCTMAASSSARSRPAPTALVLAALLLAGCLGAPPPAEEPVGPRGPGPGGSPLPPPEDPTPSQLAGPAALVLDAPEDAARLRFEADRPGTLYINATFVNGGSGDLVILDGANRTVWSQGAADHRLSLDAAGPIVLRAWARGDQDVVLRTTGVRFVDAQPLVADRVAESFPTSPLGGEAEVSLAAADVAVEMGGAATARARLETDAGQTVASWPEAPYARVAGVESLRLVMEVGSAGDVTVERLRLP